MISNNKTLCLNFYGGPCTGKSSTASIVYGNLKRKLHINCELITEYAKKKVWEGNVGCLENQLYITANQQYDMWTVAKHVDLLITDSPLLLGSIYSPNDDLLRQIILREYDKFDNIDIFLNRNENAKYQSNGRIQNKDEAIQKDIEIKDLLSAVNPNFHEVTVSPKMYKIIMSIVTDKIKSI
jgi:hypothetical protein